MTNDSTIPAKPLECRPGPDSPDQADNLWRPRRRLALRTARPPRLLIRFRNPCRRDRRRTFGWYVRFTSVPPCAGPTHSCRCTRNEWVPRAGSSGRVPRGPSRPVVRTGDRPPDSTVSRYGDTMVATTEPPRRFGCGDAHNPRSPRPRSVSPATERNPAVDHRLVTGISLCRQHAPNRAARLPATTNTAGPSSSRPA